MPAGDPFCTLQEAKVELGIKYDTEDATIERLVAAASSAIRSFCNREILATDYTRTFLSSGKATKEMKEVNKRNLDYLYSGIEKVKPGNTTADVYRAWKKNMPSDWSRFTLDFGHGIGATGHEAPWVTEASEESPHVFEKNMAMAFETYIPGGPGIASRIEENLVITDTGYEIISLCPHDERLVE